MTSTIYNVYCDESCHLENDGISVMALGAVWCKKDDVEMIAEKIKAIKLKHHVSPFFEIKWTKVSPAKKAFYMDLIQYFFAESRLHFRTVIIPQKNKLDHTMFDQSHDDWYYKMYFLLLREILNPLARYNIYIDIKDTHGVTKVEKLREILSHNVYDFDKTIIKKIQQIRSYEVAMMQLTDLLIGAMTYFYRNLSSSETKNALIRLIQTYSHHTLLKSTLPKENKFNLFIWEPKGMVNVVLPELITLDQHQGDWSVYVEVIYQHYLATIANGNLTYKNLPVHCQFRPLSHGKGFGFWHCISEGADEATRIPDLRRCERIGWIAWVIRESEYHPQITCWENKRGSNQHMVLFLEVESYVVILAKRKMYYLLKTAYCVNSQRKRQLMRERDQYWKAS